MVCKRSNSLQARRAIRGIGLGLVASSASNVFTTQMSPRALTWTSLGPIPSHRATAGVSISAQRSDVSSPQRHRENARLTTCADLGLFGAALSGGVLSAVAQRSRGGSRGGQDSGPRTGVMPADVCTPRSDRMSLSSVDDISKQIDQDTGSTAQDLLHAAHAVETASEMKDIPSATDPTLATDTPVNKVVADEVDESTEQEWQINLLYDGDCPTCMKQVEFLTKRMEENPEYAGLIKLTNLADPSYNADECGGVTFEDGMRHIHAVTRDGQVVSGMEVFRHVYRTVGMEWVYTLTKLPVLGPAFDWLYDVWAEHRLYLHGRSDLVERIHAHQEKIHELENEDCDVECEIDWDNV